MHQKSAKTAAKSFFADVQNDEEKKRELLKKKRSEKEKSAKIQLFFRLKGETIQLMKEKLQKSWESLGKTTTAPKRKLVFFGKNPQLSLFKMCISISKRKWYYKHKLHGSNRRAGFYAPCQFFTVKFDC